MFSYFKNHHRRGDSAPISPHSPPWSSQSSTASPASNQDHLPNPRHSFVTSPPQEASPISPLPPTLPPIPRVASRRQPEHKTFQSQTSSKSPPDTQSDRVQFTPNSPVQPSVPPISGAMTRRQAEHEPLRIDTKDAINSPFKGRSRPPPRIELRENDSASPRDNGHRGGYRLPGMDQSTRRHSHMPSASKDSSRRPRTPPNASRRNDQLYPPAGSSRRAPSPSSSLSSIQRSATSSTLDAEVSPASSRSAQHLTSAAPKPSKPRINILNPVSLLKRRRTALNVESASEHFSGGHTGYDIAAMGVPDDYDPRIKGKGVHDFNNPRPRRNYSTSDADDRNVGDASPVEEYRRRSTAADAPPDDETLGASVIQKDNVERRHIPVFHENFDDTSEATESGTSAVQRESLANTDFLARMSRHLNFDSPDFPAFSTWSSQPPKPQAQHQQSPPPAQNQPLPSERQLHSDQRTSKSTVGATSVRNSSDQSTVRSSFSQDTKATSPPGSPGPKHDGGALEIPSVRTAIPKHLSKSGSHSSRFSFQMNTEGEIAQEKALEEKGKQKAAKRKPSENAEDSRYDDLEGDDEGAFDDFDDDGYEEEIPLVGTDDDLRGGRTSTDHLNLAPADESTWNSSSSSQPTIKPEAEYQKQLEPPAEVGSRAAQPTRQATVASSGSAGWYFDDGQINEPSPDEQRKFDESMFDSPTDDKYKRQTLDEALYKPARSGAAIERDTDSSTSDEASIRQAEAVKLHPVNQQPAPQGSKLSTQNLETLNNALSTYERPTSAGTSAAASNLDWYCAWNEDTVDDSLDDQLMISEANAEILASDDAEYYGREFGFYGAPHAKGGELSNGGVFGSLKDANKNVVRRPDLTPITERSEYSRRTSYASLPQLGNIYGGSSSAAPGSAHALPSPGLRDIAADILAEQGGEQSLDQLMHLRQTSFGNSPYSSSSGSPSMQPGSPFLQTGFSSSVPFSTSQSHSFSEDLSSYEAEEDAPHESDGDERLAQEQQRHVSATSMSPTDSSPTRPGNSSTLNPPSIEAADITPRPYSKPNYADMRSASPTPTANRTTTSEANLCNSSHTLPSSVPSLPPHLLQKFAARPPASSATYAERERDRAAQQQKSPHLSSEGPTMTSYEVDPESGRLYLVRYKKQANGDLKLMGRELSSEQSGPFD